MEDPPKPEIENKFQLYYNLTRMQVSFAFGMGYVPEILKSATEKS
jgi:hypothetical protein